MTHHVIPDKSNEAVHVALPRFGEAMEPPTPAQRELARMALLGRGVSIALDCVKVCPSRKVLAGEIGDEVPMRGSHRCADHAAYIGGYPPYECTECGKRLYADEVGG